jgi:lathosterol oxidase
MAAPYHTAEVAGSKKMWLEFRYSMSTVLIFALIGFGILSMKNAGYTLIYDNFAEYGGWWFVSSALP